MRVPAAILLTILGATAAGLPVRALELKIIANSTVKASEISKEELQRVFLLKTNSLSSGDFVQPVLGLGSPAYQMFLKQCMGRTDAALNTYYRSLVFTGRALMPKALGSDAEVIAYVARTKGAIGYVSASTNTEGLRSVVIK